MFLVVVLYLGVPNFIFLMLRPAEILKLFEDKKLADSKLCAVKNLLFCLSGHDVRAVSFEFLYCSCAVFGTAIQSL